MNDTGRRRWHDYANQAGTAGVILLLAVTTAQAEVKKSIAVAPIQWQSPGTVSWISGEAIQAQLITELTESGRYRVVERENIEGIIGEQDMAAGGRSRKGSGPATGDIEGAQLMIKCVVTDAEEESSKGGNVRILGIGGGKKKTIYRVTMDVRIYDAQTSLILDTATVTAEQEKGKKDGGVNLGIVSVGSEKSGGDTTGAILRSLIKDALEAIDKQADVLGWKSTVKAVVNGRAVILGGTRDGLEEGMEFELYELGEPIIDDDGTVLDEGQETKVGLIKVAQVKEKVAYCDKVSGQDPAKGNVVKLVTKKDD